MYKLTFDDKPEANTYVKWARGHGYAVSEPIRERLPRNVKKFDLNGKLKKYGYAVVRERGVGREGGAPAYLLIPEETKRKTRKRYVGKTKKQQALIETMRYQHTIADIKAIANREGKIKVYHGAPIEFAELLVERGAKVPYKVEDTARAIAKKYDLPWVAFKPYAYRAHEEVKRLSTAPASIAIRWAQSFPLGEIMTDLNSQARLAAEAYKVAKTEGIKMEDAYETLYEKADAIAKKKGLQGTSENAADLLGLPDKFASKYKTGALVELEVDARGIPSYVSHDAKWRLEMVRRGVMSEKELLGSWNTSYQDIKIHPNSIKAARIVVRDVPSTYIQTREEVAAEIAANVPKITKKWGEPKKGTSEKVQPEAVKTTTDYFEASPKEIRQIASKMRIPADKPLPKVLIMGKGAGEEYGDTLGLQKSSLEVDKPSGYVITVPEAMLEKIKKEKDRTLYTLGNRVRENIRHELAHYEERSKTGAETGEEKTPYDEAVKEIKADIRAKVKSMPRALALQSYRLKEKYRLDDKEAFSVIEKAAKDLGVKKGTITRAHDWEIASKERGEAKLKAKAEIPIQPEISKAMTGTEPKSTKKEPWQMTKKEFEEKSIVSSFGDVEHGKPVKLRAYHGTYNVDLVKKQGFVLPEKERNPLNEIIQSKFKLRDKTDVEGFLGRGVYFTDSKKIASNYGNPLEVEITLDKPYVISSGDIQTLRSLDLNQLRKEGYDGIVVERGRYGLRGESYRQGVAFEPKDIVVATTKAKPTKLAVGATVVNKATGERGIVKDVRSLDEGAKSFHKGQGNVFDSYLQVRWSGKKGISKSRTEYNVKDTDIDVKGGHREVIKQAIKEKKRIPLKVLREHRDVVKEEIQERRKLKEAKAGKEREKKEAAEREETEAKYWEEAKLTTEQQSREEEVEALRKEAETYEKEEAEKTEEKEAKELKGKESVASE